MITHFFKGWAMTSLGFQVKVHKCNWPGFDLNDYLFKNGIKIQYSFYKSFYHPNSEMTVKDKN